MIATPDIVLAPLGRAVLEEIQLQFVFYPKVEAFFDDSDVRVEFVEGPFTYGFGGVGADSQVFGLVLDWREIAREDEHMRRQRQTLTITDHTSD
jgi:hypothetical protein